MNHCERFTEQLLGWADRKAPFWSWRLGFYFVHRELTGILRRLPARNLPVSGFRAELHANRQGGEMYRHLRFHIGCLLLGWPGRLLSALADGFDWRQYYQGRLESGAEVADNRAGRKVGRLLLGYLEKKSDRAVVKRKILQVLHAPKV